MLTPKNQQVAEKYPDPLTAAVKRHVFDQLWLTIHFVFISPALATCQGCSISNSSSSGVSEAFMFAVNSLIWG